MKMYVRIVSSIVYLDFEVVKQKNNYAPTFQQLMPNL